MGAHGKNRHFGFGPYRLNPAARVLLRGDDLLAIGSRAFDILVALVQNHGQVLSHGEIMALAWPGLNVEASNIRVQMTHLRRDIGCGENGNRYIASVTGRGYSFVAPVIWEEAPDPDQAWLANLGDDQSSNNGSYTATATSLPPRLRPPYRPGREYFQTFTDGGEAPFRKHRGNGRRRQDDSRDFGGARSPRIRSRVFCRPRHH